MCVRVIPHQHTWIEVDIQASKQALIWIDILELLTSPLSCPVIFVVKELRYMYKWMYILYAKNVRERYVP